MDKRKFYLVRIEKASTAMGFITENSESTPRSKATTVDADISIADWLSLVKKFDKEFKPKSVNEHFVNKKYW